MKPLLPAVLLALAAAVIAARITRRRAPAPARWQEPEDGIQADDYPWRVLARDAPR